MLLAEVVQQIVVFFLFFPFANDEGAGETVAEIVLRGGGFACFGLGAGGEFRVGLVGGDLGGGGHGRSSSLRYLV